MVLTKDEIWKYGTLGAILFTIGGYTLKLISQLVNMLTGYTGVSVNLQTISINADVTGVMRDVGTLGSQLYSRVPAGLPNFGFNEILVIAITGALFFIGSAWVLNKANWLSGSKLKRLASIFILSAFVAGLIISGTIQFPAMNIIIGTVVNAFILSWLYVMIDDSVNINLIPKA